MPENCLHVPPFFFIQLTTTLPARQVSFSSLINLAVLYWNQLQLVQTLLEVQHPNPEIFLQLKMYFPTLLLSSKVSC